jgi:O-antigen/teichoic acid export membrane protein
MPIVVVRFVAGNLADGRADLAQGVIRFALTTTLAVAIVLGGLAAIAVLAGWGAPPHDLATCILIASVLVPPTVVLVMLASVLQGFQRVAAGELIVNVARPTLMLVALLGLWWWRREPLSAPTVFVLYLIASAVILPACLAYAYAVRPTAMVHVKPAYDRSTWLRSTFAFAAVTLAAALNERVDMLLLGATAPAREIATYAIAVRFAQIFAVATSAVTAVLAPQLFDHVGELRSGRSAPIEALVRRNARTVLRICLLAAAAFVTLGPLLLKLFGPSYASAYAPLVILASGQLLAALFGPAAMVATFIGAPRIAVWSLATGIVVNASLNLVLVPALGGIGAAAANAAGTVAIAVTAWAWTRLKFDLDTAVITLRTGARA